MRKFIFALIFLLALYFVFSHFAEAQAIADTLQRGDWRWLTLAAGVQVAWFFNVAALFRAIYHLLGLDERIERLVGLAAAANFVNVVAPSMGMGGMAVFITDSRRRNLPVGRVTTAAALYVLYDYLAFLCVLSLGLIVLSRRNQLHEGEIIASLILFGVAAGIALLLYLGMRSAELLGSTLERLGGFFNKILRPFIHRDYLNIERAHAFAHDMAEGLQLARRSPRKWALPGALAFSKHALWITILFLVFLAFQQPFSGGTLIAAFSIGYLFLIVSPTPSGIGFVEGSMTLALNSMRIPLAASAVIALAYRGITFWLPLLLGLVAFRWASSEPETEKQAADRLSSLESSDGADEDPA